MLMLLLTALGWADAAFGTWTMNPARSTVAPDPRLKSIAIRIESNAKGEVFTLDRIEADGRSTTVSTILYLDGKPGISRTPAVAEPNRHAAWTPRPWRSYASALTASGSGSCGDSPRSRMNWSWRLRSNGPAAATSSVVSCWRGNPERGQHKEVGRKHGGETQ